MEPEAVRIFCEEYTAERNRLANSAASDRKGKEAELAKVKNDHAKLVDAIVAGVPADQVKDRMNELDRRRKALEHELASTEAPEPVLFYPSMAARYREKITGLIAGLSEADQMLDSKEALRNLIEKIVLTPSGDGASLDIDLYGAIAGLLHLATSVSPANYKKAPPRESEAFDTAGKTILVAGAGFGHCFVAYGRRDAFWAKISDRLVRLSRKDRASSAAPARSSANGATVASTTAPVFAAAH